MLVCPTTTLLKFNEEGEIVRVGCISVPLKDRVAGDVEALLVMEMVPGALLAAVGANVTVKILLAPALIVVGAVRFMM